MLWYIMIYFGIFWYIMVYYGILRYFMVYYGVLWYILINDVDGANDMIDNKTTTTKRIRTTTKIRKTILTNLDILG